MLPARFALVASFLVAVSAAAQTPPGDTQKRVDQLLHRPAGSEAATPCGELDEAVARALIDAGRQSPSLAQSLSAYRLAVRAAECLHADRLTGEALNHLAGMLQGHGDNDEAIRVAQESLRVHERLQDQRGQSEAWNITGNAHWWMGDMRTALDDFKRSLDLSTAIGDRSLQARVFNNVGNVRRFLGDFDGSLESLTRALEVFEEQHDVSRAAVVIDNIGLVHAYQGDFALELEYAKRAMAMREALGNRAYIAKSQDSIGHAYLALGNYSEALRMFESAFRLRKEIDDRPGAMESAHNIGLAHFAQGDYELAIDSYKRSLRLNTEWQLHDTALVSEALRNIGAAAWRLGQRARAEADFRESLDIARREGPPNREAQALEDLGEVALDAGRIANATALFDEALTIYTKIGDQAGLTSTLIDKASADIAGARYSAALDTAGRAVANANAHDQPTLLWQAQTAAGIANRRLGRPADARRSLASAIESIESLSATTVGGEALRQRFLEDKLSPYHELVAQALDEHAFGEALELAERSKARVLVQLLRGNQVGRTTALSADERRERDTRRHLVLSLDRQIENAQETHATPARVGELEEARRAARTNLAAYEAELSARHPELAISCGAVAPLTMADAGRIVADPSTAVVEYVVSDRKIFAIVMSADGSGVTVRGRALDVPASRLAADVARFDRQIRSRDFAVGDTARSLYQTLVAPLSSDLDRKTRLIIVPDGMLWNVPFQALLGPAGYLIESASISYAPSLTALREIQQLPRPPGPRTLLAMGKAAFERTAGLEPLPAAEAQVRTIRDVYGPARSAAYVGSEATVSRFTADAPRYAVLHLATHSVLDESSPLYSHLVLSSSRGPDHDDRLDALDLMNVKLQADLVILAACDTGRGRIAPGEGVIGMMWALFAAGARSMVVSQFPVESTSAATLLVGFHRRLAADSAAKAADLRAAALDLLHTPAYAHPYYWAGFILVGDPE